MKYRIKRPSFGIGLGPVVPMSESKGEWRKAKFGGRFKFDIAIIENRSALERMTFIAGHETLVGRFGRSITPLVRSIMTADGAWPINFHNVRKVYFSEL